MKTSKHAKRQSQRRGIDVEAIELVLHYGQDSHAGKGCRIYRIPYKEYQYLAEECPPSLWRRYRDQLRHLVTVVAEEEQLVVTTMHRYRPIWQKTKGRNFRSIK